MEITFKFDSRAEILIEKLIDAINNINNGQVVDVRTNGNYAETWTTNQDGESIPVTPVKEEVPVIPIKEVPAAPVTEEIPVVPVSSPTYTLAEVQLAASTFARSSETAAQQIKDVLKSTFGVARISEIEENRLVEFANDLISLGVKL